MVFVKEEYTLRDFGAAVVIGSAKVDLHIFDQTDERAPFFLIDKIIERALIAGLAEFVAGGEDFGR